MTTATGNQGGFKLRFSATQAQPNYAKLFLASGGSLNAAAADGETDFSLSHSTSSVFHKLHRTAPTSVELELPPALFTIDDDGTLLIDARAKLNVATQRESAAINGTVVSSRAGAGSAGDAPAVASPCRHLSMRALCVRVRKSGGGVQRPLSGCPLPTL